MTNQLIETICIDCNHEGNEDSKCVMTHLKFKGGTTMKGKYSMMLVIFVTLGCYYMFGLNHKLDVWLEDFINTQSWLQYISINVLFMIMMVPFYLYIRRTMQQINHINTLFMQEKDKPDFNMEKFKESIDIPSSQFIYFALFPMIVLLGLGLKIVKHYQFEIPNIIVIALYVITFIATCNYSTKLIMNMVHNQWLGYVIIFLIAVIVTYLTSTEEQMFLLLFSTVSYIMNKISLKHNYV